jgi:hypothetical protein
MLGLRSKILLGFSGLLAILIAVSVLGSELLRRYSDATQRMLRDDLAGVEAAQWMKDTLDVLEARRHAAAATGGAVDAAEARALFGQFEAGLRRQSHGTMLPAERQATADLEAQWRQYCGDYERLLSPGGEPADVARARNALGPGAARILGLARDIERLNVDNMRSGHGEAHAAARTARVAMHALTACGVIAAACSRWSWRERSCARCGRSPSRYTRWSRATWTWPCRSSPATSWGDWRGRSTTWRRSCACCGGSTTRS